MLPYVVEETKVGAWLLSKIGMNTAAIAFAIVEPSCTTATWFAGIAARSTASRVEPVGSLEVASGLADAHAARRAPRRENERESAICGTWCILCPVGGARLPETNAVLRRPEKAREGGE